jgi:uncharacterized membrane protein YeiH
VTLNTFVIALEVLGVIAFALSGVIEAARKHFDLVGVVMVSFVTAFGGGTLRDILLERKPFFWVEQELWVWGLIGLAVALPFFFRARHMELTERAILVPDAIGLGIFTAGGTHIALELGSSPLVSVLMGVITAVVGGVFRDVLVNEVPRAFHDHQPYAVVAFAGGWVVVALDALAVPTSITLLVGSGLIILVRLMAIKFGWELKRWRFL